MTTYGRPNIIISRGKGCHLYDTNDRAYLDFTAGIAVCALGHADPEVAQVLYEQAKTLVHTSNLYYNDKAGELAEKIVTTTQQSGGKWASKIFLANSGTEANEGALKFARKWGKHVTGNDNTTKTGIVSFVNGFHGRSMGALSATYNPKYQLPFAPLVPGFKTTPYNDVEQALNIINDDTCGVIVEPFQGEGGVHPATTEFLEALRKRCDETGALLIFDEIQCGLGRTGKLWGHEHHSDICKPDLLTMAKPLANGVPIGAVLTSAKVSEMIKPGDHGTTFGGNPLAAGVALNVFGRLSEPSFLKSVTEKGNAMKEDLNALKDAYPDVVKAVRGEGLLLGIELVKDPSPIVKMARERGLLVVTAGSNTVRIVPPLTLTKEEAREGIARLAGAIEEFKTTL
ncbi:pyridoxal phosphate-dependent transferase [Zychaea mexicana]|uniref:pyridoxal phosphate-dependent transferase n=1 Tax=Zychaea mexicana TaxID=64656 RepID=UPI0022FE86C1|nr:pyridoxal phosphate-dependent transferase [Zychaea mexicana]KAI9498580.1 pyridoxal phosphate-dependent transferase [Zychaea mexicana]